jgi:hypothetical protein
VISCPSTQKLFRCYTREEQPVGKFYGVYLTVVSVRNLCIFCRDWDLWGPLLLCLLLGIMLSINVCATAGLQIIYNRVHGRHPLVSRLEFSQVLS